MRRFTTTVACWAIVFVLPAPAARAAHWPSPNRPDDLRYLDGWRMAAANPRRTGWVPESVPGPLQLEWYKPFEPFISQKVQVIAADGLLFIATARGLYAIDAETGEQKWVYATDMPLGHSPTVVGGVAYVGCFDCRIHAIDAKTGKGIWISEPAGAGFATNPVVEQGKVFAGNRDGIFYALDAATGRTLWTFQTELRLPILYSAAYRDGTRYFAGNDMHAYALEAATGRQLWKSQKLPGACFNSWWPVIYLDRVILTGSSNYRGHGQPHTIGGFLFLEDQAIFRSNEKQSGWGGALAMDADVPWTSDAQRPTLDMSRRSPEGNGPVSEYYESMPWRRTYFVLDRGSGREFTYDFDGDGRPDYAPLAYVGTHSGNRYPPIVGGDGLLYQTAGGVRGQDWISRGGIVRWKLDSPFIGVMSIEAHDESQFISGGGNLIQYYHGEYHDGTQGSIDIGTRRMLAFYWYIDKIAPDIVAWGRRNPNYMHGPGGSNPPISYRGRVYQLRWNHVICFSPQGGRRRLAVADVPDTAQATAAPTPTPDSLRVILAAEVEKMLQAGHLRTGWMNRGLCANYLEQRTTDDFDDYFSLPAETIQVLARALPFLPADMQPRVRAYLKAEFEAFPPDQVAHIGWRGAAREVADLPPEMAGILDRYGPITRASGRVRELYTFPPHANYALFRYAEVSGDAAGLAARLRPVGPVPREELLRLYPWAHNAFIAALAGIVGLSEKAGRPDAQARAELDRLLRLRAELFSKDRPAPRPSAASGTATGGEDQAMRNMINEFLPQTIARNFMFLTPQLAACLRERALDKVRDACREYERIHPHWFVSRAEEGWGENSFNPLFDYHTLFQAKAMILKEPYQELAKHLDVPGFWRGDLYYLDNLCACLEAAGER